MATLNCPAGFLHGAGRCYASTEPAVTVRECVDLCAAAHQGAAPACITSPEQNSFVQQSFTVPLGRSAWLGRFRNTTTNLTEWEQCVSDESPGTIQLWDDGHSGTALKGQAPR